MIYGGEMNTLEQNTVTDLAEETLKELESSIGHQGMVKVVKSFLDDLPKTAASINNFLMQKNLTEIHKIGHRNKSPALCVGAKGLAGLFLKLEKIEKIEAAAELNKEIELAAAAVASKLNQRLLQ